MGFDIVSAKDVAAREDEGTVVELKDQNGEPLYADDAKTLPVTITVAGTYSTRYRRAVDQNRDRMLKRRQATLDGEQLNRQSLELIAAAIIAWSGLTESGADYPLTKENAIALLDACPWIREQVEMAASDHASFFAKS